MELHKFPIPVNWPNVCAGCATALVSFGGGFDVDGLRARFEEVEAESARPDLWENRENAQKVNREKNRLEREIQFYDELSGSLEDAEVLLELANEAEDEAVRLEVVEKFDDVEAVLEEAELRQLLGGEHDRNNAILSVNSGAGGTDACDWAEMLMRMYLRWAERKGYKVSIIDIQYADEAGIRSVTLEIAGDYAYGYLNSEQGVHRLVRISPFDSQARRHTAFASVTAVPEIDDEIEIEIDEKDLRVDTYRSSGAGGQHVNKTDSAIRITHLPSGIVLPCQHERSQHQDREYAVRSLKARLLARQAEERAKEVASFRGERVAAEWVSQIRSYVLHPYKSVKDHRTNLQSTNPEAVLNGDIDGFIEAYLMSKVGQ